METEISETQIMRLTPSESPTSYESMLNSLSSSCCYLSINLVSNLLYSQELSSTTVISNLDELKFKDERKEKHEFIDSSLLSLVPQSKCTEIIFNGFDGAVLAKLIKTGREHLSGVRMVRVEETGQTDKWLEQISEIEGLVSCRLHSLGCNFFAPMWCDKWADQEGSE